MQELHPFRLLPDFRERVWGSRDLSPIYSEVPGDKPIGEVWLTGDENRAASGPLAGSTLGELCRRFGRALVGEGNWPADRFPLLIKFLFPRDKLSVQVHPDDETARRVGQPCGKTECWYVVRAEAGARIGLGLKPGATREELSCAIREIRAEELLNWLPVRRGEMIYVDAGTVHAIGPGSILVETQQNSDTTYRLYDYGRPRELHVEQGLAATKERTRAGKVSRSECQNGNARQAKLVSSPCFEVDHYELAGPVEFDCSAQERAVVQIVVGIEGGGVLECGVGQDIAFTRGECVVVPAAVRQFRLRPQWQLECLRMTLPQAQVPAPETVLE
jgi:mannose-6-phosphate isomerase